MISYFESWQGTLRIVLDNEYRFPITNKTLKAIHAYLAPIHRSEAWTFDSGLNDVYDSFSGCKPSKEKTYVFLEYANVSVPTVPINDYVISIRRLIGEALTDAAKIPDMFERGISFKMIADFAGAHAIYDIAVQSYYRAKEGIQNSIASNIQKQRALAGIETGLGSLFVEIPDPHALSKTIEHEAYAAEHMMKVHDRPMIDQYLTYATALGTRISEKYAPPVSVAMDANTLSLLRVPFNTYQQERSHKNLPTTYYMLTAIGAVLQRQGYLREAIRYGIESALTAQKNGSLSLYTGALNNIAMAYAFLGNARQARRYAQLIKQYIRSPQSSLYEQYTQDIAQALLHLTLKQYKDAIKIVKHIESDSVRILKEVIPVKQAFLYKDITSTLFTAYTALNNVDSALIYERQYNLVQQTVSRIFPSLLQVEGKEMNSWLERSKNREIATRQEMLDTSESKRKSDSVNLKREKELRHLSDLVASKNADIANKNRTIADQNIEKAKQADKQKKTAYWTFGFAAIAIIAAASFVIEKQRRKKLRAEQQMDKANLRKAEAENALMKKTKELDTRNQLLRTRMAIKNHNLGNHYLKMKELLREGDKQDKAMMYCESNSTYFKEYYKVILKEKVAFSKELSVFKKFLESEQIYYKKTIEVIEDVLLPNDEDVVFVRDLLVPLYENAQKYAFVKEEKPYYFKITVRKHNDLLICHIADNGEGHANIEAQVSDENYLGMLRDSLINDFESKSISLPSNEIFEIHSEVGIGTTIQLKFPYEKIEDSDS